jgi:hypothetical protein
MRVQAGLVLGVCCLALAVPAWVAAAPPDDNDAGAAAASVAPPHRHKGLFGWRHCVECQRAYVKAHDGVDIPPPPALGARGVGGQVIVGSAANCAVCQGAPVGPGMIVSGDPNAPGYAVVGGPVVMQGAPGYAVVGDAAGPGPAPVGVARSSQAGWNPHMAAAGMHPGAGPYDPAVMQSGLPPAQVALASPGHDRPHVISHLFGLPRLGQHRREREEKARERHASIAYDRPDRPVTELPASMVYGNGKH